ncbi:type I restriction endonuclease [Nostoc sp.]|uniref:type I restriction endonuclease n=1 Tax=Nostoc sp. TaxID=1180 RepID=UPI002FFAFA3B
MSKVGQRERLTQNRIVQLFQQQLNYRYLGNWHYRPNNSNIETEILSTFLGDKQGYSNSLITKALYELNKVAGDKSLYDINKEVYSLLRYGVKVKEEVGENTQTVWLINWEEPLENSRESIKALCEPVEQPQDTHAYIRYFCGADTENPDLIKENQQQRIALYKYTSALVRAYANLSNDMAEAGYTTTETEIIKQEVKHYEQVRAEVKLASGDYIDLKAYEPAMRHLIDTYIGAEESEIISAFDDMTLIQLIVERGANAVEALPKGIKQNQEAVAETIENNLRKVIIDQQPTNPKYFDKMSTLLNELIQARKAASQDYKAYLQKIVELSKQVAQPSSSSQYPQSLNSPAKRALYDNLNQDEALALAINDAIRKIKKDGWRGNIMKEREVKNAIKKYLDSPEDCDSEALLQSADRIFEIVKSQSEY